MPAPTPDAGAEEQGEEVLARFQKEVLSRLPPGLARVCVLGGREFRNPDVTVPLIESIAGQLRQFGDKIVMLTGGMPGVQEAFAKSLGSDVGTYNLLPVGEESHYGMGQDLACGRTLEERMAIFGRLGDIYLTFEGGPGVAQEAAAAYARGAVVLALRATGGASAGALPQFPSQARERPEWASADDWQLLGGVDAAQVAPAVARLIAARRSGMPAPMPDAVAEEQAEEVLAGFQEVGDIHLTFQAGPGVGLKASMGYSRGAEVLAVRRSGMPAPMPDAGAEEQGEEVLARFQKEVLSRLPPGLARVCVLGGREFKNPDVTVPLIESIAGQLRQFGDKIVVLTGGMPGVQEAFAKSLGSDVGMYNLLTVGEESHYGMGQDLVCGRTLEESMAIFGRLGDIYLTFEGGPGVAQEAATAYARGAVVLALRATGGASAGALPQFPSQALERPEWASADDWQLLGGVDAAQVAPTVARLIAARLKDDDASETRSRRACCEGLLNILAACLLGR